MKNIIISSSKSILFVFVFTSFLMLGWSCNSGKDSFIDYETITKDDAFRSSISSGKFVKLSNGHTYYEYANPESDTIIVMVHGFSVPSYIWDSTYQAAVTRGYGALRYDTYGRGYSDNPDVDYTVALYTQQLQELLDTLNINSKINLVGLSDGGRTISGFAAQYPEHVQNLIFVDPTGFQILPDSLPQLTTASDEEIMAFKKERYPTMASGQLSDFYDSIPFRGWDKKYAEIMQFKGFVRALISTGKNRASLEKEHRAIATSNIPVFVIWGEYDTVVKLDEAKPILSDRIPKAKLFVINNAGHLPHMEQTTEFNDILFHQIINNR